MTETPRQNLMTRLEVAAVLVRAGILRPGRPDHVVRQLSTLRKWGPTASGTTTLAALRFPQSVALVDDARSVTYGELDKRATRLANGLASMGVTAGARVALLCRNHAYLIESMVAGSRLGLDVILINTGLSAGQLSKIVAEHTPSAIIVDDEFADLVKDLPADLHRIRAWHDSDSDVSGQTVDDLIASASDAPLSPPPTAGRTIVLTSGTTGAPKGARRPNPKGPGAAAAVLSRIPLRLGERILVSAPLFHTWGLAALQLGLPLHATLILQRRFDPEGALRMANEHRATAMFAVPVMLQRMLELPDEVRAKHDTSSLKIAASSGSALPAPAVTGFLDAFGDILYNLYGSTEVSWASIAQPVDLRREPSTAGRPPVGTTVAILDESGNPVPAGDVGRIFVGNDMLFDGYVGIDKSKEVIGGLMSTGDRGHIDASGLLFVSGRDDDMIVSGGENVFPREVEDLIADLPGVLEVAVAGVPDEAFGQRFAAYVVLDDGVTLSAADIRDHVRAHLARFSVPRDVVFVDALPRNATGKVVLRALADLH